MEYKVIHSADLQEDLTHWAAERWELFDSPQPWRQPGSPALWLVIMERDETTGMDFADSVTLATIVSWAERQGITRGEGNDHAQGYAAAVRDIRAILKVHGQPPDTPVIYGS